MARMTLRPNAVRLNTAMLAIASLILIAMVGLAYRSGID